MILQLFAAAAGAPGGGVLLHVESHQVVLDNGVVQVWVSKPQGQITAVRYGDDPGNLLHFTGRSATGVMNSGGYWDLIWNFPGPGRPEGMTDVYVSHCFKLMANVVVPNTLYKSLVLRRREYIFRSVQTEYM